jgi:hypothetical protein
MEMLRIALVLTPMAFILPATHHHTKQQTEHETPGRLDSLYHSEASALLRDNWGDFGDG